MRWCVLLMVLASCGDREVHRTRSKLPDNLIIDCVGSWTAEKRWLKFWGDNPQYRRDDGSFVLGDGEPERFFYYVNGDRLRLWLDYGRTVKEVPFKLELWEESSYADKYHLIFAEPVFGARIYEGTLGSSYNCEPREDQRR